MTAPNPPSRDRARPANFTSHYWLEYQICCWPSSWTVILLFLTSVPPLFWGSWKLVGILEWPVYPLKSTLEYSSVLLGLGRFLKAQVKVRRMGVSANQELDHLSLAWMASGQGDLLFSLCDYGLKKLSFLVWRQRLTSCLEIEIYLTKVKKERVCKWWLF